MRQIYSSRKPDHEPLEEYGDYVQKYNTLVEKTIDDLLFKLKISSLKEVDKVLMIKLASIKLITELN